MSYTLIVFSCPDTSWLSLVPSNQSQVLFFILIFSYWAEYFHWDEVSPTFIFLVLIQESLQLWKQANPHSEKKKQEHLSQFSGNAFVCMQMLLLTWVGRKPQNSTFYNKKSIRLNNNKSGNNSGFLIALLPALSFSIRKGHQILCYLDWKSRTAKIRGGELPSWSLTAHPLGPRRYSGHAASVGTPCFRNAVGIFPHPEQLQSAKTWRKMKLWKEYQRRWWNSCHSQHLPAAPQSCPRRTEWEFCYWYLTVQAWTISSKSWATRYLQFAPASYLQI